MLNFSFMPFRFYPESLADHFSPRLLPLLLTLSVMLPDLASAADEEKRDQQKTEKPADKVQSVEVSGPGAASQRRNDTAAKIVVGRDELLQFGDTAIADVMKRLPGVSVVGSDIRMRGLGAGYTQIMVNGERTGWIFYRQFVAGSDRTYRIMRTTTAESARRRLPAASISCCAKVFPVHPDRSN